MTTQTIEALKKDPYASFRTDKALEQEGIYLDYGRFRIKGRRAGGANAKFAKSLNQALKPHRREVQMETIGEKEANAALRKAYAEGVVIGWEVLTDDDKWVPGVHDPVTGEVVEPSVAAYIRVFEAMPDLFHDAREQFTKAGAFLVQAMEGDSGN